MNTSVYLLVYGTVLGVVPIYITQDLQVSSSSYTDSEEGYTSSKLEEFPSSLTVLSRKGEIVCIVILVVSSVNHERLI